MNALRRRSPALIAALAMLGACVAPGGPQSPSPGVAPAASAGAEASVGAPSLDAGKLHTFEARPSAVVIEREGDPLAAVALVVTGAGGLAAHTALAALGEARLRASGLEAQGSGDRDGLRLVVLVADAAATAGAVRALDDALRRPLGPGDPGGVKLAAARVAALRARALDDDALEPFAACAGEASPAPSEKLPSLGGDEGARQIEAWRGRVGSSQSAFGFAGPAVVIGGGAAAVGSLERWAPGVPAEAAPGREGDETAPVVVAEAGRARGTARVTVAAWLPGVGAGPSAAARLGERGAKVAGRLRGLRSAPALTRAAGVARRGGSCVVVSAEARGLEGAWFDEEAATIAAVLRQEVLEAASYGGSTGASPPLPSPRLQADPRAAAAAGAWLSLATAGAGVLRVRVALGVAAEAGSPRGGVSAPSRPGFATAYGGLLRAEASGPETKGSQEQGQGELRLLLASACPVVESPGEHGTTALALLSALRTGAIEEDGVGLDPWLDPAGAGVMATGRARAGESAEGLARRVAGAAARALLGEPPEAEQVQGARASLLARLGVEAGGPPAELWSALAPEQPSRLFALGSSDGVARASVESVRLRWSRLASGPLRLAVLTTGGLGQLDAATAAVARWQPPSVRARVCAGVAGLGATPGKGGEGVLASGPRAFVGWRVDASGRGAGAAAVTALLLGGREGMLASALDGLGVTAQTFVAGRGAESAVVIELRGPQGELETAIDRSRGAVERLESQVEAEAGQRALARWRGLEREAMLDPRQRLADLWSGAVRPAVPEASEWRRWVQGQMVAARGVVLRPRR